MNWAASGRVLQSWQIDAIKHIESRQIVEIAFTGLVRNLDDSEWSALFEGEPYKKLCEDLSIPE